MKWRSHITFCLSGPMLERTMGDALREGAQLRDIARRAPRHVEGVTDARGYRVLSRCAEKRGAAITALAVRGWPVALAFARRRWPLAPGLLVGAALIALACTRVWSVDVIAPEALAAQVRGALYQAGARPGANKAALNLPALEDMLLLNIGDASFASLSMRGMKLTAEVQPALLAPEVYRLTPPTDIVAGRDGVVHSVLPLSGLARVKPGDTVRKGQLLIEGTERVTREESKDVRAMGEVIARVWYTGSARVPTVREVRTPTGRVGYRRTLVWQDQELALSQGPSYENANVEITELALGGLYLPVRVVTRKIEEVTLEQQPLPEEEIRQTALELAERQALEACPYPDAVVDKWVVYSMIGDNVLEAKIVLETHENIAREISSRP